MLPEIQVKKGLFLILAVNESYHDRTSFLRRSILCLRHRVSFISPRSPSLRAPYPNDRLIMSTLISS